MDARTRLTVLLAGAAAAIALVAVVLYGNSAEDVQPAGPDGQPAALAGVVPDEDPVPVTDAVFYDAGGAEKTLADFRGRFLVVNLWATWCAPCVAELPALARAQDALPEDEILILPVDMEQLESDEVRAFLDENGAGALPVYVDRDFQVMRGFEAFAVGLPYTVFIDAAGNRVAAASGPQEWDDPAAVAYIRQMAAN